MILYARDVIFYAAGLTRMRFQSFLVATAFGIAPQTFLYSYLGRQAPEYAGAFLVSSALVIVGAVVMIVLRRNRAV